MDTKLVKKLDNTQSEIAKIQAQIIEATVPLQNKLVTLKEQDKKVREAILEAMKKNNVKSFESDRVKITYIAPTKRKGFDAKRLESDDPKLYAKYVKYTDVKDSIRITPKED